MPVVRAVKMLGIVLTAVLFIAAGSAAAVDAEDQFLAATHTERAKRGIDRLSVSSTLTDLARRHSERMANNQALFHNPSIAEQTRSWSTYAENVASGTSVAAAQKALMDSSVHRANILDPSFDDVGMGAYWSGGFVWLTQVFADRFLPVEVTAPLPPPPTTLVPTTLVPTTLVPTTLLPTTLLPTTLLPTTLPPTTVTIPSLPATLPSPTTGLPSPNVIGSIPGSSGPTTAGATAVSPGTTLTATSRPAVSAPNGSKSSPTTPVATAAAPNSGLASTAEFLGDFGLGDLDDVGIEAAPAGSSAPVEESPRDSRKIIAVVSGAMAVAAQAALVMRRRRVWT